MKPYERLRKVTRHFDFLGLIHASNDNIVRDHQLLMNFTRWQVVYGHMATNICMTQDLLPYHDLCRVPYLRDIVRALLAISYTLG